MIDSIQTASVIFLMGGTTSLQMEFLLKNQLIEPIRNADCLMMGLSAGAINMAKTSILTITSGHKEQEIYNGIDLVDISVEPHFTVSKFNEELKKLSYNYLIHGICDESAIIVRGDERTYYGDIFMLRNGDVEKVGLG
jgi:peptidase E